MAAVASNASTMWFSHSIASPASDDLSDANGVLRLAPTRLNPRSLAMKASSMCGINIGASLSSITNMIEL